MKKFLFFAMCLGVFICQDAIAQSQMLITTIKAGEVIDNSNSQTIVKRSATNTNDSSNQVVARDKITVTRQNYQFTPTPLNPVFPENVRDSGNQRIKRTDSGN